jgi:hypothetical protein
MIRELRNNGAVTRRHAGIVRKIFRVLANQGRPYNKRRGGKKKRGGKPRPWHSVFDGQTCQHFNRGNLTEATSAYTPWSRQPEPFKPYRYPLALLQPEQQPRRCTPSIAVMHSGD